MLGLDSLKVRVRGAWLPAPGFLWRRQIGGSFQKELARLNGMSPDHRRIRAFAVTELPKSGRPLTPAAIAKQFSLRQDEVATILADLEGGMTYLFRNQEGALEWAYPVTAAPTPHRLTFSSGQEIWGA